MSTHNVPGAALALIKDGSIVLEKGYGFRDLAADDPVTTATLFNIGSISKSFTVLGIAQLSISIGSIWTHRSSDTSLICG
jgi:CubicO group peptidase (beta-lactamase class C family)